MTIAPPAKSFGNTPVVSQTPLAKTRAEQERAARQAWLQSPEGQQFTAAKMKEAEDHHQQLQDLFQSEGWDVDDNAAGSSQKKAAKNRDKQSAKKGTGLLAGLAAKLQNKSK